jgi:16S rRNA (cytosine967-C5)-methyltransferase
MQCNNTPPPIYLSVNGLVATPKQVKEALETESVRVKETGFGPEIFEVMEGAPQNTRAFSTGLFYIQDAAIATLRQMIAKVSAGRVLEVAAAPGGKTLQLAMEMRNEGLIASLDSDLKRMRLWRENKNRLRISCAEGLVADAASLPFGEIFDCVAIDAPCSSLGVVRRHPEIKWWRKPEHLPGIQSVQKKIISACSHVLQSGGTLIYSVCSFEPEETGEVTSSFQEYEILDETLLYPHKSGTDGFYFAKLRKK